MHCKITDCYFNIFFVEKQLKKRKPERCFLGTRNCTPKPAYQYSKRPQYVIDQMLYHNHCKYTFLYCISCYSDCTKQYFLFCFSALTTSWSTLYLIVAALILFNMVGSTRLYRWPNLTNCCMLTTEEKDH